MVNSSAVISKESNEFKETTQLMNNKYLHLYLCLLCDKETLGYTSVVLTSPSGRSAPNYCVWFTSPPSLTVCARSSHVKLQLCAQVTLTNTLKPVFLQTDLHLAGV